MAGAKRERKRHSIDQSKEEGRVNAIQPKATPLEEIMKRNPKTIVHVGPASMTTHTKELKRLRLKAFKEVTD